MTKSSPAAPEDEDASGPLEIEIDPFLIEEALQSLEEDGLYLDFGRPAPKAPGPLQGELDAARASLAAALEEGKRVAGVTVALETQLKELREAQRAQVADFERYRTRARKDSEESERRGEERALRALIDIFDNVERARVHSDSDPTRIAAGLQMIVDQFRRQLTRVGLERISAARGDLFDPEIHEAVAHVDGDEVPDGAVVDEVTPGFRLRGRLFRPARVTVAARSIA